MTVASTGRLTGVEVAGRTEALGSESGGLSLTVADRGVVEGDVQARGGGALTLDLKAGGAVTGTVHDPVGLSTVVGSIGRLLYSSGGTVTVASTGRLTGVEVAGRTEALRSDGGDLSVTVAGMVTGDVLGLGSGDHRVTVEQGGAVAGTVRLAASTVTVDGAAGRVWLDGGGTVTVGRTGRVAGVEGVGIRSETGDLTATISGRVEGDVLALGAGAHRVTVAEGGQVAGTVRVATRSAVMVGGRVGSVRLDEGGTVTVGGGGAVAGGTDGVGIGSGRGELVVTIRQGADETPGAAALRVQGRIVETGGTAQVLFQAAGEEEARPLGAPDSGSSRASGAFDVGVVEDEGGLRVRQVYAPRSRVYEALPSVLLGMNGLSEWRARAEAPRASNGAWTRMEASGGTRGTRRSTSASGSGIVWSHRRWGVETGVDFPLEAGSAAGVSMHHRRGSAKVSGNDGRIEVSGAGLGASAAWRLSDGGYVDGRLSATWYEASLKSGLRGPLKSNAAGFGHALGVEAGRRQALDAGLLGRLMLMPLGELTLTQRARLVHSRVDVDDFTDSTGARVSIDKGRETRGRAGVRMEMSDGGAGRLYGSLDVEHAFSTGTRVTVAGTGLSSRRQATRVLVELGGAVAWGDGRYALHGAARWATGARDYGGGLTLNARF